MPIKSTQTVAPRVLHHREYTLTIQITVELIGKQPILFHNIDLANPFATRTRALNEIQSKRKKTDADRLDMAKLEWYGGLYVGAGIEGPAVPTRMIRKCLIEGARINKLGKQVERAITFEDMMVPLSYEGSRDLDVLYASGNFVDQTMVKVGVGRILRTRPKFPEWAVVATAWLEEDQLNPSELRMIAEQAGRSVGLGDNRVNGYGRFRATVKEG